MDLVGKYLGGRYAILEKVGNGGMATVYKAKDNVLNRYVAVKVLKDEYTTDTEFIRKFNAEAQSAAGLTHANIVSIYDVGHEDNIYYIVMELIQGKTLKQIINQDGSLPWKWTVNIAIQIAAALETAHKNGIVHRDIKPHNIIITEDGVAKVTDFGIAKAVSNSTITAFGTTIGSVHYFSPEHAKGGFTDAKSDLYSLGVVMYEMLTGRVPFDADTPVSIALKHMQEMPVEPIKINKSIPSAINQIIMKAMQKDPNLRYQSATEMIKDLKNSIKNPDGDFVGNVKGSDVAPINEAANKRKKEKKNNKLIKYFEEHKEMRNAALVAGCIILFILVIFITKAVMNIGTIKDIPMPNLVGKTEQEIIEMFKGTKLTYTIKSEEYNSEVEEGKVISQEPEYRNDYPIKENRNFEIVISKGTKIVTMPKVEGQKIEDAKKMLEELDANLILDIKEEENKKVEPGIVTKQSIAKDEEVKAGTTITLTVSKEKEQVSVPYVIGKTEEDASKELTDNKLKVNVVYEEDTGKNPGVVLKQNKEVGTMVDQDTVITITVNRIEDIKSGTVTVNLKSITKYEEKFDEEGNTILPNDVRLKVTVTSKGTVETAYDREISPATEGIDVAVSGKGTVTVKVYIDGALGGREYQMNLNEQTTLTVK